MRKALWTLLFLAPILAMSQPKGQKKVNFQSPLDIPLILSGTFGELRSNHFHAGIDIKTGGAEGKRVLAAEGGYVSRIKVSPYGYGKALYITHPNGYTTVYAHLQRYSSEIEAYVDSIQYHRQSFAVEIFPKAGELKVDRGQVVALSGNSGGSGGPHLHFEIRDTRTEKPINPLLFSFDVSDQRAPEFFSFRMVPVGKKSSVSGGGIPVDYKVLRNENAYSLKTPHLSGFGYVGFAIGVIDRLDKANNRNGIYSLTQVVDGDTTYVFEAKTFAFAETRYINAHMDYALKMCCKRLTHRTFLLPGNDLSMYSHLRGNGSVEISPGQSKDIVFYAEDAYGNRSELHVVLKGEVPGKPAPFVPGLSVNYKRTFTHVEGGFSLKIPARSLYQSRFLPFEVDSSRGLIGPAYTIGNDEIPSQKYFTVELPYPPGTQSPEKLIVVSKSGKKWVYEGAKHEKKGVVTAKSRTFGVFSLAYDSIAPRIKPVKIQNGSTRKHGQRIQFFVADNTSGISSFKGKLNGKWILFEYDYKSGLLTHTILQDAPVGTHSLTLEVEDEVGNQNTVQLQIKITP